MCRFADMTRCDPNVVTHAVTLFLKYNHPTNVMRTKTRWFAFEWQRTACLWIALKFSDSDRDEIDPFVATEGDKRMLIAAEVDVMRFLDYQMSAPPDYM
jgi:hypothetical protein